MVNTPFVGLAALVEKAMAPLVRVVRGGVGLAGASLLVACVLQGPPAMAQSATQFTYQGRLDSGAGVASGRHDMRFTLWTAATDGTQAGSAICVDSVSVTDGLFSVPLDFGAAALLSQPRFLQIEVRSDTTPGNCGTGSFTMLSPRQALTSAPFAASTRGIAVSQDGKIGLGGLSPLRGLSMSGGVLIQDLNDEGITLSTNTLEVADANDEVAYRSASLRAASSGSGRRAPTHACTWSARSTGPVMP
jgi:hypothetical protein